MDQKPQFSVLLCFHNQRNLVEPSLTALYDLKKLPFELILIDDASTDGTGQAIQSLVDYFEHSLTFFFDHEQRSGRGNSLNEALQQSSASIVWVPKSIEKISEDTLQAAICDLKNSAAPSLIANEHMSADVGEWTERIIQGSLPGEGSLIFNKKNIPAARRFINPFLNVYNSVEWLLRLEMDALENEASFYTPSQFEEPERITPLQQQELLLALLRRPNTSAQDCKHLTNLLLELPKISEHNFDESTEHMLLEKAVNLKLRGQFSEALDCVEEVLRQHPDHPEANHLKIKLLEGKRRFVEASELKHTLRAGREDHDDESIPPEKKPDISLIIPTAVYGKPALENCLLSVDEYCDPTTTELIIVDNASLDDTHEYLEELQERNFFNCQVVTNAANKGFAGSINQALEVAEGTYACIIHNDVEFKNRALPALKGLLDAHPEFAMVGPKTNRTLNPAQRVRDDVEPESDLVPAEYLDSFCFMMRTDAGMRMDEIYGPAFFEDVDLSFQMRRAGYNVGLATQVEVSHKYGQTTYAVNIDNESDRYWKNLAYFNDKWDIDTFSDEQLQSLGRFEQLLALDDYVNPLYPEKIIKEKFSELFTDEMKTEIRKTSHEAETMLHLIHLTMVMGKREMMRELEKRAEDINMPASLIYEIVRFYFNHNVYSRCLYYLDRLQKEDETLQADLYRLGILIDEKKMESAIPLLTDMLQQAPANPMLYKLAGDIYAFKGDQQEAESFYTLAHQINPFQFSELEKEIRLHS